MIEVKHVFYAETLDGAVRIMENALSCGVTEVRAVWLPKERLYRVEYKTEVST